MGGKCRKIYYIFQVCFTITSAKVTGAVPTTKNPSKELWMMLRINGYQSIRAAAKRYGIPNSTLQRHYKSDSSVFTTEQEAELIMYLKEMENRCFGLIRAELKHLARQYAENKRITHPFNNAGAGDQ